MSYGLVPSHLKIIVNIFRYQTNSGGRLGYSGDCVDSSDSSTVVSMDVNSIRGFWWVAHHTTGLIQH